ncbi:MAG: hypothetical protein JRI54_11625, partial [Deltaproteobacteria bacterium]|nr:hypothetical protein [Deltaproteobacteria bacterium]
MSHCRQRRSIQEPAGRFIPYAQVCPGKWNKINGDWPGKSIATVEFLLSACQKRAGSSTDQSPLGREGRGEPEDLSALEELSGQIKDAALCGLGQTGPNPVLSTLRYFRDEYEAHILEKRCPAKRCVSLLKFAEIAELDGCYVIKTDLPDEAADMDTIHDRYKDLAQVERAFRNMKTGHLEVRPV